VNDGSNKVFSGMLIEKDWPPETPVVLEDIKRVEVGVPSEVNNVAPFERNILYPKIE
jgi:hypothetical protein